MGRFENVASALFPKWKTSLAFVGRASSAGVPAVGEKAFLQPCHLRLVQAAAAGFAIKGLVAHHFLLSLIGLYLILSF